MCDSEMENKDKFLKNEIWMLSILGAFGRNKIYSPSASASEKAVLRDDIRSLLDKWISDFYLNSKVEEHFHIEKISKLKVEVEKTHKSVLFEEQFNFGTSQKLFNLYLKYLWCLGKIAEPPHFPVDRIMIEKIMGKGSIIAWTKMKDPKLYQEIIDTAKKLAGNESLAEFELKGFSRRP